MDVAVTFRRGGDDAPNLLRRVDKVRIARRLFVPAVTEELADQRQVFFRHDGLAGCRDEEEKEATEAMKNCFDLSA